MFGANPFGQSSSSPFGSQPVFGQNTNANSNPFAPKPFGNTAPFGAQTGNSFFGSTANGVFGNQNSSPMGSTSGFGASSTLAFGSSTPAFGASSTPAFGSTSSPFGGTSGFGQNPAFGAFGSSSSQTSQFGNSFQQSQPAFGSTLFGSSSQSSFGNNATASAFGASSTPAFGATNTSPFGSSGGAFGSTPAFGASSTPAFGSSNTGSLFGASSASAPSFNFGQSTPAFGQTTPAFGQTAPAFGQMTPAFGQTTPAFGQTTPSNAFGSTTSPFGGQANQFGSQASSTTIGSPGFGQSTFGTQRGGSRVTPYAATTETDPGTGNQPPGKLVSLSAMSTYKDKSQDELRWEDYQLGDKGGPAPANQSIGVAGFGPQSTSVFSQPLANNTFSSSTTQSNPFAPKTSAFSSSSLGSIVSTAFTLPSSTPSNPLTSTTPSLFGTSSSFTTVGASNPISVSSFTQGTTNNGFGLSPNFNNSRSSPLFQSTPSIVPSNAFIGNMFSSTPSLGQTNTSFTTPFQNTQPAQTMTGGSLSNFGQAPAVGTGGYVGSTNNFGQTTFVQSAAIQNSVAVQQAPFGTLPTMPQMSIARTSNSPTVQYGISSMPVVDKAVPVRVSSFLTARHLSQRRVRLPTRKYHPNVDALKVFFRDDEETYITPKADAFFIPRENPRALVVNPLKQQQLHTIRQEKTILFNHNDVQNGNIEEEAPPPPENGFITGNKEVSSNGNGIKEQSQRAAITLEHGTDIETLMPKLIHSDYYTEPRIQELAAKERAEPGYCHHVRDFIVGRHGYGSIKFIGETDVGGLDIESLIKFNHREVIVYFDESKKPPIGQGLNKAAEVTLLNIKGFDKKTGKQYTAGPMIDKYVDMLKRKAIDQDAEFVSYDPIEGEWKFRVRHFSIYKF